MAKVSKKIVLKYKENDQQIAGMKCLEYVGGKCVSSELTGTYTLQMDHAKLVKLNANYEERCQISPIMIKLYPSFATMSRIKH